MTDDQTANWLFRKAREAGVFRIAIFAGLLALTGLALAANERYWRNFLAGPYDITPAEIAAVSSADELTRYWVRMSVPQVVDAGVNSISGHYWIAQFGEKLILVDAPSYQRPTLRFEGALVDLPDDLKRLVLQRLKPEFHAALSPVLFDIRNFEDAGRLSLGIAAVVGILAIGLGCSGVALLVKPAWARPLRRLAASGVPIEEAANDIEHQINSRNFIRLGDWMVTSRYAVRQGPRFGVEPLRFLLRIEPIEYRKKLLGVIPLSRTYGVRLTFRRRVISAKLAQVPQHETYKLLHRLAPWALIHASPQLRKDLRWHRAKIAAVVEARYQHILAAETAPDGGRQDMTIAPVSPPYAASRTPPKI